VQPISGGYGGAPPVAAPGCRITAGQQGTPQSPPSSLTGALEDSPLTWTRLRAVVPVLYTPSAELEQSNQRRVPCRRAVGVTLQHTRLLIHGRVYGGRSQLCADPGVQQAASQSTGVPPCTKRAGWQWRQQLALWRSISAGKCARYGGRYGGRANLTRRNRQGDKLACTRLPACLVSSREQ
jgi:hypothetical protein